MPKTAPNIEPEKRTQYYFIVFPFHWFHWWIPIHNYDEQSLHSRHMGMHKWNENRHIARRARTALLNWDLVHNLEYQWLWS